MKKTLLSSIILAGLIFSSCSNFLEETAYSSFDKEEAYSNPTLVYLNAVASVYTSMGLQGVMWDADFGTGGINYLSEYSADLGIVQGRRSDWVDGGVHQQIFLHSWTPSHNLFLDSWNYQYQVIGLCNASIDDLQAVLDEGGDEFLQDYINELRAVRAYYYMSLVNMYARIPIVTSSSMSVSDVAQSTRKEAYEFVRDELTEIIPTLSDENGVKSSSEYYGRMTKAAGYMMMARLAANAAIWSQDDWNDGINVIKSVNLAGKDVALFGCGDSMAYSDTFCNGMHLLKEELEGTGCNFIGGIPADGYSYSDSTAVEEGEFIGAAIDDNNEPEKTGERIDTWLASFKDRL